MGEIIRKTASHDDIIADVRRTLTNAQARGGKWKDVAEEHLDPVLVLIDGVEGRLAEARKVLAPLASAVLGRHEEANGTLGRVSDEVWNDVGRPAGDPALSLLFPGGVASYTRGDVNGQPDRMDLLAELLETNGHPRLDPAAAKAQAQRVRAAAEALRAAVSAAATPATRVEVLQRVRRAVVTSAQAALTNVKRLYKAAGFSEADIHTVIPDRPLAAKRTPPAPAPQPTPSPPATEASRG